jgi:polysaccharide export outer membrane protein
MKRTATIAASLLLVSAAASFAGQAKPAAPPAKTGQAQPGAQAQSAQPPEGITPPADYLIGPGDVLIITFWKEPDMSAEQQVRPDGRITLPLLNDVSAMGLKPDQLRDRLAEMSKNYLEDPRVTVGLRQINSRKVYIYGGIAKAGAYDLLTPTTVLQLISVAGGTREFVSGKNILIIRTEDGKPRGIKFNLKEVQEGKNLEQNILLKPGDTVQVPE